MSSTDPQEIPFDGIRVRFDSDKTYEELVAALLSNVGEKPVQIGDLPAAIFGDWNRLPRRSHVISVPATSR